MARRVGWAAFAVSAVLYVLCAAPVPFYTKGEPREALVVEAIHDGYGVVLPRRDGRDMPSKPPFFHWLAALSVGAGVRPGELAMRLPSVLLGAAGVGLTAGVATQWYGPAAGVLAATMLASSVEWLRAATQSRVDMTLTFLMLVTTLAWHAALVAEAKPWLVRLGYLSAAAAVLTKGPVGLVLPALVVAVAALGARIPGRLWRLVDLPGAAAAAVIVGGWYLLAWRSGGAEFITRQLMHENLRRFAGGRSASHAHPFYYYVPALAGGFCPWTLALAVVAPRLWRERAPTDRFLLGWVATVFAFYSLASGKRSVYLLPLYPPLAMRTAAALADVLPRRPGRLARAGLFAGAGALVAAIVVIVLRLEDPLADVLSGFLSRSDQRNLPAALDVVHASRVGIALVLLAGAAALVALGVRGASGERLGIAALVAVAVAWAGGLTAFGTYPLAKRLTPRPFAEQVRAAVPRDARLCTRGFVSYPLRYYVGRPLRGCPTPLPAGELTFVLQPVDDRRRVGPCVRTRLVDDRPREMRFQLDEIEGGCLARRTHTLGDS